MCGVNHETLTQGYTVYTQYVGTRTLLDSRNEFKENDKKCLATNVEFFSLHLFSLPVAMVHALKGGQLCQEVPCLTQGDMSKKSSA